MVTKNSVNKLVKGGRWTGRRLGKSIILSVIEELHGNEQLISSDEIRKILSKLTDDDRNVYNKYANVYNGVVDLFNFVSACDYQGKSGTQTLLTYLTGIVQSFEIEQNKNRMPLLVTERQYKRYKEKYNDLLKEKAQDKEAYAFDNAVPEKHKMQVAKYGIAEIHPTGMLSRINNADDEEYQSNQIEIINTASSIENLANDKDAIQTIKNSYTEINVCLSIMQAYDAFVDGLALAGDEVRFKGLKEHMLSQDTKEKIDMVNSLIAMIYTDFEDYDISKSITKKYQKLFKELFPPIDVNKKRTAMTTQEVADYIDYVFDNSNNDVFSATRTLLAIRGGASID